MGPASPDDRLGCQRSRCRQRPHRSHRRDRFARHYSDFAALWRHPSGRSMATRFDLLERVRTHNRKFFGSSWAQFRDPIDVTYPIGGGQ